MVVIVFYCIAVTSAAVGLPNSKDDENPCEEITGS